MRSSLSFIEGCLPLRVIFWQRQTDKQKNPFIGAIASAVPKKVVKVEWNQLKWDITYDRSRNIFQKYFIYILDGGGTIFLLCWNFSATELPVHLRLVCTLKFVRYDPVEKNRLLYLSQCNCGSPTKFENTFFQNFGQHLSKCPFLKIL